MNASDTSRTNEERLARALKDLMRAYVSNLESARERILFHGGECDSVEVMERGDPYLRQAREALQQVRSGEMAATAGSAHCSPERALHAGSIPASATTPLSALKDVAP